MRLLFKGGTVITGKGPRRADILVEGEKILDVCRDIPAIGAQVVDVSGMLLFPGFIDAHTHFDLDVCNTTTADDFASGSRAALHGGTTTIIDFACPNKGETLHDGLRLWHEKADGKCACDYGFHMTIDDWNETIESEIDDMYAEGISSFKMYMTYPAMMIGDEAMYKALKKLKEKGGICGVHCENAGVIDALIAEKKAAGENGVYCHPETRPDIMEAEAVGRLLRIAEQVDIPVVIVHTTNIEALDEIANARWRGQKVFVETCPQYLVLDDSVITVDWRGYVNRFSIPEAMLLVLVFVAVVDFLNRILRKLVMAQVKETYRYNLGNTVNEGEAINVLADKISEKIVINRHDFDNSLLLVLRTMTSITAGDMKEARMNLRALKKLIGNDPIIDLLKMKIYKGEKDFDKMEKLSAKIMKNEDIRLVGMKAAVEAQMQKKEFAEALATANKAFELRQDLYWVIESAFELRAKAGDWDGALQVLSSGIKKKIIPQDKFKRLKAIVLFEMALEAQKKGDDVNFFRLCSQAIECDETLVPAAVAMARYYVANDNQFRKAAKVLLNAWAKNPTADVAYEYLKLYPKDDITAKIQRMETLSQTNVLRPSLNNIILAELATEAGLWGKAKAEIEMFLINNPATKKLAGMISKYEKFSNNDKKEAAKWKEKEASCADDAMWVCDECGHASAEWEAVCPHCNAFGQSHWRLYVEKAENEPVVEVQAADDDDE